VHWTTDDQENMTGATLQKVRLLALPFAFVSGTISPTGISGNNKLINEARL
jgi:hypothetical protein